MGGECMCVVGYTSGNGTCNKAKTVVVSLTLTKPFIADYNNLQSAAAIALAQQVVTTMDAAMKNNTPAGYEGVQVISFTAGSTIVNTGILFVKSNNSKL